MEREDQISSAMASRKASVSGMETSSRPRGGTGGAAWGEAGGLGLGGWTPWRGSGAGRAARSWRQNCGGQWSHGQLAITSSGGHRSSRVMMSVISSLLGQVVWFDTVAIHLTPTKDAYSSFVSDQTIFGLFRRCDGRPMTGWYNVTGFAWSFAKRFCLPTGVSGVSGSSSDGYESRRRSCDGVSWTPRGEYKSLSSSFFSFFVSIATSRLTHRPEHNSDFETETFLVGGVGY